MSLDKLLPFADNIIVLDKGKVLTNGSLESLKQSYGNVSVLNGIGTQMPEDLEKSDAYNSPPSQNNRLASEAAAVLDASLHDHKRQLGDFSVYRYYADVSGHQAVLFFLIFMILWAICGEFPSRLPLKYFNVSTNKRSSNLVEILVRRKLKGSE